MKVMNVSLVNLNHQKRKTNLGYGDQKMNFEYRIEAQGDGKYMIRQFYSEIVGETSYGTPIVKPSYRVVAKDLEIVYSYSNKNEENK